MKQQEIILRYGNNPHQIPARIYCKEGTLPLTVLNGSPGYINLLDALNSWQLVRELDEALALPAAASFKHVSPAGVGVGLPVNETLRQAYQPGELELSPLASAYLRARCADRVASFGDWIALSRQVDLPTAQLIAREVSDGVIAPAYEPEALEVLKAKKRGNYVVLAIDPEYEPREIETRDVFGITFEQKRNNVKINETLLQKVVTANQELPSSAQRDLIIALITLKYTQSNSVCFAYDGQAIGVGAGQQSRILCTRLAAAKAENWFLRQHPAVLNLPFKEGLSRAERDNAIDLYLRENLNPIEEQFWQKNFQQVPARLSTADKRAWLKKFHETALASDAFFPFRDNIDRAAECGVKYIAQPGGSIRDQEVIDACNEYQMVMVFTGVRLFHH
ncbi:MAG: phosphoribosylaminoimidazolecarboxamide formyltransferase [Firmicutes bacterium]|nr:phosphoribosylaminoimidazolecarboxamide formyltransferase [Bacillota bacterium]